jgi:branched-chain amino acid transport system ATP-binding protein
MAPDTIIKIHEVSKAFAGIRALDGTSFSVEGGRICGLIGPNGAGKTTLINVINGIYRPDRGAVNFGNVLLNDLPVYEIAKLGISRTFQIARVFRRMSVLENMKAPTVFLREKPERLNQRIMDLLTFVGLSEKKDHYALELSGGQQKLLEFARALVSDPRLVLMDEPFAGVHPDIKSRLIDNIKALNREGKSFIIVSHDMGSIADLCHSVVVLNFGRKLTEGPTDQILHDEEVIRAYLGE